jgi:hypothetical protein
MIRDLSAVATADDINDEDLPLRLRLFNQSSGSFRGTTDQHAS